MTAEPRGDRPGNVHVHGVMFGVTGAALEAGLPASGPHLNGPVAEAERTTTAVGHVILDMADFPAAKACARATMTVIEPWRSKKATVLGTEAE
jgi:hypothetical protein